MRDWTPTEQELPAEGVVVETMRSDGTVQEMFRKGKLWFQPDGKMYVYYTPVFWKPKPGSTRIERG